MIPLCDRSDIAPIRSTADDTVMCTTAVQLRKARQTWSFVLSVMLFQPVAAFKAVTHGNGESVVWRSTDCLRGFNSLRFLS
nr:MAG TPA: hypothetical protein [Caudoviricetes sp.]